MELRKESVEAITALDKRDILVMGLQSEVERQDHLCR